MKLYVPSTLCTAVWWAAASSSSSTHHVMAAFSRSVTGNHRRTALGWFLPRGGGRRTMATAATVQGTDELTTAAAANTATAATAYDQLVTKLEAITHLSRASAVLSYDQQVFMPTSASAERGAQLAALATVVHQQKTDPELLRLMDLVLEEEEGTTTDTDTEDKRRLLELERKSFLEQARVPTELAAHAAELSSQAYQVWVQARQARNFSIFEPTLTECFQVAQQLTAAKQQQQQQKGQNNSRNRSTDPSVLPLYDFMLDEFECGMTKSRIDDLFQQVQDALVPLIQKVLDKKEKANHHHHHHDDNNKESSAELVPSTEAWWGDFDIQRQQELSKRLVKAIGFNAEEGRIDVSVHPFTSSMSPSDVRITSRFRSDEWYQGLAGSLHEAGHAMYEQGLPKSALSIDTALSMGTHESQSLFWERHVGLSQAFWDYATPIVHELLPQLAKYSSKELYGAINAVSDQSLIRVEADELSYPLHVILRYKIEKDVIGGTLQVADIPQRWNSDMKHYLNVIVPSDDKGCLQDVHWAYMAFGYFPTYLIGAMAAAQLFHYCSKDLVDIDAQMERGEFKKIQEWLFNKVHRHGRRYTSLDNLLNDQLGEPLNPQYFLDYLTKKYSDLYQL